MEPNTLSTLRKFRKERGVKIIDMAKELQVPACRICAMEYGKKPIGELWARRFSQYFEVDDWKQFLNEVVK